MPSDPKLDTDYFLRKIHIQLTGKRIFTKKKKKNQKKINKKKKNKKKKKKKNAEKCQPVSYCQWSRGKILVLILLQCAAIRYRRMRFFHPCLSRFHPDRGRLFDNLYHFGSTKKKKKKNYLQLKRSI